LRIVRTKKRFIVERMVISALAVAMAVFAGPLFFAQYDSRLMGSGVAVTSNDEAFVHAHSPASAKAQATQEARWEGGRFRVASCATGQLLLVLLRGKDWACETLADVWSLPLSRRMLALARMTFVSVTLAARVGEDLHRSRTSLSDASGTSRPWSLSCRTVVLFAR
jgi:hypothetical protein